MQTGLIAPIPHLNEFADGPFHLILSHLLDDKAYFEHYRQQALTGSYLLLDNSAHELGVGRPHDLLLDQAIRVGASELACPDVLSNENETLYASRQAMQYYRTKRWEEFAGADLRLMLIPQGRDPWSWARCLNDLIRTHIEFFEDRPFTVGVPKAYEKFSGGTPKLMVEYVRPLREIYDFDVHMLGLGRDWRVLATLAGRFSWIRSTDSAKPFVYALADMGVGLEMEQPEYPGRPENYFHAEMTSYQLDLARTNVHAFQQRAEGKF